MSLPPPLLLRRLCGRRVDERLLLRCNCSAAATIAAVAALLVATMAEAAETGIGDWPRDDWPLLTAAMPELISLLLAAVISSDVLSSLRSTMSGRMVISSRLPLFSSLPLLLAAMADAEAAKTAAALASDDKAEMFPEKNNDFINEVIKIFLIQI